MVLAHAEGGFGTTLEAAVVLVALGLAGVFVLAVLDRISLDEPGDLVLPLAVAVVLATLSGPASGIVSDWVGWWLPVGATALVAALVAVFTPLDLSRRGPLAWGAVAAAVLGAVTLHGPIERRWHGPARFGVAHEDVAIAIAEPTDGQRLQPGQNDIRVTVDGGTIGTGSMPTRPDDPEELGVVRVLVDGTRVADTPGDSPSRRERCRRGCTTTTYSAHLDRGPHVISVEFVTADGQSFVAGSPTIDVIMVEVG